MGNWPISQLQITYTHYKPEYCLWLKCGPGGYRMSSFARRFSVYSGTCCSEKMHTVYPKKYAHGFCFAVLCCGYTLTDFPISIRLSSLALWQSNDCPSASKATLMNMDKYFMWIHYERLHNHNKAKHNKTVCIFLGIYCTRYQRQLSSAWHWGPYPFTICTVNICNQWRKQDYDG